MKVKLLQPHTPVTIELETGATLEVTTEKGLSMISDGIAIQVDNSVPARVANADLYHGCQPPSEDTMAGMLAESQKILETSQQEVYAAIAFNVAKGEPKNEGTQSDKPGSPPRTYGIRKGEK